MEKFKYSRETREKLWKTFDKCKAELMHLSGIVQNEMPLTLEDINEWVEDEKKLIAKLHDIKHCLTSELKEEI